MNELLKKLAKENFSVDSLEIVNMFFLINQGSFKYTNELDENNTLTVLKENNISYEIKELLNGQKHVILT
jgi:hypothetical protein